MRRRRRPETIPQASGITIIIQVTRIRQPVRDVAMARPSLCTGGGDTSCSTTTGQQGDERLFKRFGLDRPDQRDRWPKKWFQLLIAVFDSLKGISASMSTKSLRLIRRRLLRRIVTLAGGQRKSNISSTVAKKAFSAVPRGSPGAVPHRQVQGLQPPRSGRWRGLSSMFLFSKIYLSIWKYAMKKLQSRN